MKSGIKSFKAAILVSQNEPLVVDTLLLPDKLLPGQVLVKIHVSGICGSQLGEISGVKGPDPYLPHLLGHEGCATVLEIGAGVKHIQVGDKVVLHWKKGLGMEAPPPNYLWKGNKVNAGWITTFNSHAIISENRCTKIDKNIKPSIAALFGCAVTTGFGVIQNNAKIQIGESIVVFGAGGIGLNIIQAAKLRSAWPIIAVDIYNNKLKLAKKVGATYVINSNSENPEEAISKLLNGQALDVFVDNTGIPKIIEMGYKLTHSNGRIILVGVPKKGEEINIFSLPLHFGKTIVGSHGGECQPSKDIPQLARLVEKGVLNLDCILGESYTLEDINDAIAKMRDGSIAGRVTIET
ncbi:zinc-binding dehydrogenase [Prochlorococcus sp. MIT 1300]|uniref:zinc-binding dehydrogenase n=1 Tax=Prochlorococcus sp. MIT 1300 TaxID=3096218 RepID=UPI002A75DC7F|nr:zinc-binding dehydrogenase [Prochlorococcus sp. MIT 1300]